VKGPLKKVLGKASLRLDELVTVLTEVEGLVNSRPLTSVSTDLHDEAPLTPGMMLGDVFSAYVSADEQAFNATQLNARWKYVKRVQQHLEQRWKSEYLTSLRHYHQSKSVPLVVGDVVLVADNQKKRHLWRMGRIVEMYPGKDGKCRVARVRIGQSTLLRAVQCLVSLEVRDPDEAPSCSEPAQTVDIESAAVPESVDTTRRSARSVKPVVRLDL